MSLTVSYLFLVILQVGITEYFQIVLFALQAIEFAIMFLVAGLVIFLYFLLLHTVISTWDRIKRWFIKRARKSGGVSKMTLQDVKMLLIYTRKIFGVKATLAVKSKKEFRLDDLRKQLRENKRWEYALNIVVIIELLLITGAGIYAFMIELNMLDWLTKWWYLTFVLIVPIFIVIIGLSATKARVKLIINTIPAEQFDQVLKVLNEFRVFGGKTSN
ncbi:MAG: hypothetical protein ACTSSH_10115 [Candidatus Heimdallarchaeota archaeon]